MTCTQLVAPVFAATLALSANVQAQFYRVTPLTSNETFTPHNDPDLRNGWGLVSGPTTFNWVADNATGTATIYDGNGIPQSLVVSIPSPGTDPGAPTGAVFSGGAGFVITHNGQMGPSRFLFATEEDRKSTR